MMCSVSFFSEPVTLSIGKIAGIVIFCVTCIGYLCLACAKSTRKRGSRGRTERLTRDYAVPAVLHTSHTCNAQCTQSRTTTPPSVVTAPHFSVAPIRASSHRLTDDPLPSYAELTDLPSDIPQESPPSYSYVVGIVAAAKAAAANINTWSGSLQSLGHTEASNQERDNGEGVVPKDGPPSYGEVT